MSLLCFQNIRSGSLLSAYRCGLHYVSKGESAIHLLRQRTGSKLPFRLSRTNIPVVTSTGWIVNDILHSRDAIDSEILFVLLCNLHESEIL